MGYTYRCDSCDEGYNSFPPFAGEFTEEFLETTREGGTFAAAFSPGDKVTLCADCMKLLVMSNRLIVCRRCGMTADALESTLPPDALCPRCEEDALTTRRKIDERD